jgi:HEAT repeat protein
LPLEFDFNVLTQLLSSPAWEQRRDAAEDLGAWRAPEAIPYLIRGLSDPVGAVQYASAVALGQIGTAAVVPTLLACLENPNFHFPAPVLEALGNLRVKEAVPMLIRYLRHADPHIRGLAANALIVTTKKAFRYSAKADEEQREAGVQKWEQWWAKEGASFEVS